MENSEQRDLGVPMTPDAGLAALEERAEQVATLLGVMANSRRLLILCRLAEGEASVGQLQKVVGVSQSALSQHLARLREAGMVATRREAQTIHYRLADPDTRAVMSALYDIFCAGKTDRAGMQR